MMQNREMIVKYLKQNLSEDTFAHSLSVEKTAIKMARVFHMDEEKAALAGLIHDCAKSMSQEQLILCVNKYQIDEQGEYKAYPYLLHGPVGAAIAKEKLGIYDDEILMAVKYHTTGRANMQPLEKLIYLADMVEPLREESEIEKVRELSFISLDRAIMEGLRQSIQYVMVTGRKLHPLSIEAWNDIVGK